MLDTDLNNIKIFRSFVLSFYLSSEQQRNIQCLRKLGCVSKLIHIVQISQVGHQVLNTVASVLSVLLHQSNQKEDLLLWVDVDHLDLNCHKDS